MLRGHEGARKQKELTAYLFAENPVEVRDRIIEMPAVRGRYKSIRRISDDQAMRLEKRIVDEGRITLEKARETWYYPDIN